MPTGIFFILICIIYAESAWKTRVFEPIVGARYMGVGKDVQELLGDVTEKIRAVLCDVFPHTRERLCMYRDLPAGAAYVFGSIQKGKEVRHVCVLMQEYMHVTFPCVQRNGVCPCTATRHPSPRPFCT